jgi:hypothetical protein
MRMALEQIRRQGLEALPDKLGRAGMIRFSQRFETGEGDDAQQRRERVDAASPADIERRAAPRRRPEPPGQLRK